VRTVFSSKSEMVESLTGTVCRYRPPALLALLLAWTFIVGCGGSEQVEEESNLRSLAAYYSQYQAHHRGNLPASEKDFKDFIRADLGASEPQAAASVDDLFISNRDGKPFVIKYRGDKSWSLPGLVAYEQEGHDGTRHVATSVGGYAAMSEEEFRSEQTAATSR
jgi:hypothetical protein